MISPDESRGFAHADTSVAPPGSANPAGDFHAYDAPAATPGFERFAADSAAG